MIWDNREIMEGVLESLNPFSEYLRSEIGLSEHVGDTQEIINFKSNHLDIPMIIWNELKRRMCSSEEQTGVLICRLQRVGTKQGVRIDFIPEYVYYLGAFSDVDFFMKKSLQLRVFEQQVVPFLNGTDKRPKESFIPILFHLRKPTSSSITDTELFSDLRDLFHTESIDPHFTYLIIEADRIKIISELGSFSVRVFSGAKRNQKIQKYREEWKHIISNSRTDYFTNKTQ